MADPATAQRALDNARALGEASIPGPAPLGPARGRFVAWHRSHGTPGPLLLVGRDGDRLADQMGRLALTLQRMPAASLPVDAPWRSAGELRHAAGGWLDQLVADEVEVRERRDAIRSSIEAVCREGWSARPTHGDFVPANVLMHEGRIEVLLDVTGLALRHPEVDLGWWELVVGFHHPGDAARLARSLRRGYGAHDAGMDERLRDVGAVRALQLAAAAPGAARGHAVALLMAALG